MMHVYSVKLNREAPFPPFERYVTHEKQFTKEEFNVICYDKFKEVGADNLIDALKEEGFELLEIEQKFQWDMM